MPHEGAGLPFDANDVAQEIVEVWLVNFDLEHLSDSERAADIADSLNGFYGIKLNPEDIQGLAFHIVGVEELARLIEPMRSWPAMMRKMPPGWDWMVEMPHDL